ncbi:MAG: elongation factor Ts [Desulfuromonas sp. SDB]|nr:MAG: elongation factor Ts [Desulfuromonas sp. SDB]
MSISKQDMLKLVKELRARTDAGVKECKAVLTETGGDIEKAVTILREKGIAKADSRSGRSTKEGVIGCYLHREKIAGLVELTCETDFVARTDLFKNLAKELAIQVVTSSPQTISREELSPEYIEQERAIFKKLEKESGKPDKIIDKIVEGKLEKLYREVCLLEQDYYKDDSKTVDQMVKEAIAKLGENIEVKRIFRMQVGES